MTDSRVHLPLDTAPAGTYEQINIFGSPAGVLVHHREEGPLPPAPIDHTWRLIDRQAPRTSP
jgi:hypothetical protein